MDYIVYKMGDTVHGVTTFRNYNNFAVTYTAQPEGAPRLVSPVTNAVFWASGGFITEETTGLTYTITSGASGTLSANGGTASISWTVTGVPNFLCAGRMFLPVKLILQDLDQEFTWHNHDELAGVYLSRMVSSPTDTMTIPWGDFAFEVGLWGWGATTKTQAHQFLVDGIHYSERHAESRVAYDSDHYVFYTPNVNPSLITFHMGGSTGFLASLQNNYWTIMDCQDFASVLNLSLECNGITSDMGRLQRMFGAVLVTNDLCPAGTDSTNTANYDVEWFNFHVVVRIGESARSDACSSYLTNLSGAMHLNPVFLWSFPGYWQTWIPVGTSGFYTGLANAPSGPYDNVVESVDRSPKAVY